jgi:Ran GTPase-activating protein (RanGAP) involved in mRNA processing and transport
LIPLIDAIGTNDSITHLDISGNNIGNKGAMALAKAIQTNQTLTHLVWDENGTTLTGFQNFKYLS